MKLTPFGQKVRMLRIELSVRLKDMADELNVTSAYLSALETGKKNLTDSFVAKVVDYFDKHGISDTQELYQLADASKKEIRIDTSEYDDDSKLLIAAFARRFSELPKDDLKKILNS